MKRQGLAALLVSLCAMQAQAQSGVRLERFGLQDVAATAECAARRMPSQYSMDVLATYWGPPILMDGACVASGSRATADTLNRARQSFLPALSACVGYRVADDASPGVRRIAYATAVIAANGLFNHETGRTKLDEYIGLTRRCEQ